MVSAAGIYLGWKIAGDQFAQMAAFAVPTESGPDRRGIRLQRRADRVN
jgi:hypothetical protein